MRMARVAGMAVSIMVLAGTGGVGAWPAAAQAPNHQHDVDKRLADKRAEAEAHRKQMEATKDPERLSVEMRKHFQMTEDMLALMLERRKQTTGQAPKPAPGAAAQPAPQQGMSGMQGGMSGMHGMMQGMMQQEKGGMPMQGGAMQGGGRMQSEMGGMAAPSSAAPAAPAAKNADTEQMMQRIVEHSKYMETIQDRAALGQEMLRHQRMLDQMLELLQ